MVLVCLSTTFLSEKCSGIGVFVNDFLLGGMNWSCYFCQRLSFGEMKWSRYVCQRYSFEGMKWSWYVC